MLLATGLVGFGIGVVVQTLVSSPTGSKKQLSNVDPKRSPTGSGPSDSSPRGSSKRPQRTASSVTGSTGKPAGRGGSPSGASALLPALLRLLAKRGDDGLNFGQIGPPLGALGKPDEIAGIASRDLANRPTREQAEVENRAGRTTGRCSRGASPWFRSSALGHPHGWTAVVRGAELRIPQELVRCVDPGHALDVATQVRMVLPRPGEIRLSDRAAISFEWHAELGVGIDHATVRCQLLDSRGRRAVDECHPIIGFESQEAIGLSVQNAQAPIAPSAQQREVAASEDPPRGR